MWWAQLLNNIAALFSGGVAASTSSFESIATATLAVDSTSIQFTSIPQTYSSLQIRGIGRSGTSANGPSLYFNNVPSGTSYAYHNLYGDGTSVLAQGYASQAYDSSMGILSATANIFNGFIIDIHDYASTTRNKTTRALTGVDLNGSGSIWLHSSVFTNTSAITQIDLYNGYTWKAGTTFALYGIKG